MPEEVLEMIALKLDPHSIASLVLANPRPCALLAMRSLKLDLIPRVIENYLRIFGDHVRSLDLSACTQYTGSEIGMVTRLCPQLTKLNVVGTWPDLWHVLDELSGVEELSFSISAAASCSTS